MVYINIHITWSLSIFRTLPTQDRETVILDLLHNLTNPGCFASQKQRKPSKNLYSAKVYEQTASVRQIKVSENSNVKSTWPLDQLTNVGHVVSLASAEMGESIAVAAPANKNAKRPIQYNTITFSELEYRSNQIALGLQQLGIQPGTRIALMVPPGIEFISFVFGLFKSGVVIILIDPGMGKKNMVRCLSEAQPQGIVGIRIAHVMRMIYAAKFRNCKTNIVVGASWWPGCTSDRKFYKLDGNSFQPLEQTREADAAIIFTTGSTGPPKGVSYKHRIFLEQARQVRDFYGIEPGSVDVSGFPLFALFNCGMGTTTVFPKMDATRPAEVDPLDVKDAIDRFAASQSFGSPALWNTVSRYAEANDLKFPTIKKVFSAGAPVPPHVLSRIKKIIASDGEAYTPYGATESLPVASNNATVVLDETAAKTERGFGTCVGNKFPDIDWKIIEITDQPIDQMDDANTLPNGEIGELIVKGSVVTDRYVTRTQANAMHKIQDENGFWHRMGDVGYFDDQNRFWFCGRKSHRVQTGQTGQPTLFTIVLEGIVNTHEKIYRSALVGIGAAPNQTPIIVAEPWPEHWPTNQNTQKRLEDEILEICRSNEKTQLVEQVLLKKKLPVDIRHNSKIFREQLAIWARSRIKKIETA